MSALNSKNTHRPLQSQQYTCPMHPEIIRDHPGSCPICGMSLELKTLAMSGSFVMRAVPNR